MNLLTEIFPATLEITGTDSFFTDATSTNGMKISNAAIHSTASSMTAWRLPGGRRRGSGEIESQRSTDIVVRVNTLAATATPEDYKNKTSQCTLPKLLLFIIDASITIYRWLLIDFYKQ